MTSCTLLVWPEPVVRVQSLSDSGEQVIPPRYVKPAHDRPLVSNGSDSLTNIPLVDLNGYSDGLGSLNDEAMKQLDDGCREWGFFQVVNHGVSPVLMERARKVWREFFHLPMELKQEYSNSPNTYEGYGSRLGVEKGALLDWSDYYFLHFLPHALRDHFKWPALPTSCREVMEEYCNELVKLCGVLIKILNERLGLCEGVLQSAFGGEDIGACLRINFYPKCPQPDLTLGLSPHSDPGGLTLLLPDLDIPGLQVQKDGKWVSVKPVPHAFIVNIGDQIQVLSNSKFKSVEHRVVVNPESERVSLALFYNPKSDIPILPLAPLVTQHSPALFSPMTFDEYRLFIRLRGPRGKSQVDSLASA